MKIAYSTIIWGREIDDINYCLSAISAAGYSGVEFSQRPDRLPPFEELLGLLKEKNLALVGLSGGLLSERVKYCGDHCGPHYLVVYDWDAQVEDALKQGFFLALHPHPIKPNHRLVDAMHILEQHRALKFLPDTALLSIIGESPATAVKNALDLKHQLAGIHLKDWSPEFGSSAHRYARGFTELGNGRLTESGKGRSELEQVLDVLQRINYSGWIVVEQDNTNKTPEESALISARWLFERKILHREPKRPRQVSVDSSPKMESATSFDSIRKLRFMQSMMGTSNSNLKTCYQAIATAFSELVPGSMTMVMLCNPTYDVLNLLAEENGEHKVETNQKKPRFLSYCESLSRVAIDRQDTTSFNLKIDRPAATYGYLNARFGYRDSLKYKEFEQMVSVPILGLSSPHHARLVVNIFPGKDSPQLSNNDFKQLFKLGEYVGIAADSALDEICSFAAASANHRAAHSKGVEDFLDKIRDLIVEIVECEAVSIFIINDTQTRLELVSTTGLHWLVPEDQYYKKGENLTGRVWENREAILTVDAEDLRSSDELAKSVDLVRTPRRSCLMAPFVDSTGNVVGVVRCKNKISLGAVHMFTNDDVAVLEAIGQAVIPHLQLLLSEERRTRALGRMIHEFKTPIVAIRGATDIMMAEFEWRRIKPKEFFGENYFGDILSWTELLGRLLGNAEVFRTPSMEIPLNTEPTLLLKHVIAPAVHQVDILLKQRRFHSRNIQEANFHQIPELWLDRNQFQQVIFNLLANAIKYCYGDPNSFQVRILAQATADGFEIHFQDWGPGIKPEMQDAVFKEGVRSPEAIQTNVAGQGLGLWVVRRIVKSHGGQIRITNLSQPTRITISLPRSLKFGPPNG